MRKLTIFEHISLDGVLEQGEDSPYGGWTVPYRTPAGLQLVIEAQGANFDLLLGRRTYDLWAHYWPKAGNSPVANSLNAATKYVATHRPESLKWGPAKGLGARPFLHLPVKGFVLDPVGDHEQPVGRLTGVDHTLAGSGRSRHRLFAKHVFPGFGGADRIFFMETVG